MQLDFWDDPHVMTVGVGIFFTWSVLHIQPINAQPHSRTPSHSRVVSDPTSKQHPRAHSAGKLTRYKNEGEAFLWLTHLPRKCGHRKEGQRTGISIIFLSSLRWFVWQSAHPPLAAYLARATLLAVFRRASPRYQSRLVKLDMLL